MANALKMALIETIYTLHHRGWSRRRIARELGINRETVARYLQRPPPDSKPANAPIGSEAIQAESKPANAPTGSHQSEEADFSVLGTAGQRLEVVPSTPRRVSQCEPWRAVIEAKLAQDLSVQRIFQDLVGEHGFAASYYSVRRFVNKLAPRQELPVRRLECAPGEEAQVDFGAGAWVHMPDGKRRKTHVFRIVLSHSRKAHSEVVYRQTNEDFLHCLENAFQYFGGVPRRLVLDNLKAGVLQPDWYDPELHPRFASFCQHYRTVAWPLRPRKPEHKGKVERGVGYVQDNGLKGHTFTSLEAQNQHLLAWETTVADTRIHGTTRQQVGKYFLEVERPALQPLPPERFPFFHEGRRSVSRDAHVEVDHAYYSVPPEYLYRRVWVRWDGRLVKIFDEQMRPITTHAQREPGRFSTHDYHLADEKICEVERGAGFLLKQIRRLGHQTTRWAEGLLAARGIEGIRALQGLKHLARRYHCEQLEDACGIAYSHGCYRLRTLRQLLDRRGGEQQETFTFLDQHPLIRPLEEYDTFIHHALRKESFS
jgi:transposase